MNLFYATCRWFIFVPFYTMNKGIYKNIYHIIDLFLFYILGLSIFLLNLASGRHFLLAIKA